MPGVRADCCSVPCTPTARRAFSCISHRLRATIGQDLDIRSYGKEAEMADYGAPLVLMAIGLVLWMAVSATLAGISIQTIGIILTLAGLAWLVIELVQSRPRRARVVRDEPVVRERELY
jgi:hypothetical protein